MRQVFCANPSCQKPFSVPESRFKAGKAKHCSLQCYNICKKGRVLLPVEERFSSRVQICIHGHDCPYCCWPWKGRMFQQTHYGVFSILQSTHTAHRVAWNIRNNKEMSAHLEAAHYCHNRPCCNPDHIHAATSKENKQDSLRDGIVVRGSLHKNSKVTEASIQSIFIMYSNGHTMNQIAHHFSISLPAVAKILHRKTWQHVAIEQAILRSAESNLRKK